MHTQSLRACRFETTLLHHFCRGAASTDLRCVPLLKNARTEKVIVFLLFFLQLHELSTFLNVRLESELSTHAIYLKAKISEANVKMNDKINGDLI